jgi:hypothetical protein
MNKCFYSNVKKKTQIFLFAGCNFKFFPLIAHPNLKEPILFSSNILSHPMKNGMIISKFKTMISKHSLSENKEALIATAPL